MTHNEVIRRIEAIRAATWGEMRRYERTSRARGPQHSFAATQARSDAQQCAVDVEALDYVLTLLKSSKPREK